MSERFNEEITKKAIDLYNSGCSMDYIAYDLGYSCITIKKHLSLNGVKIRHKTETEKVYFEIKKLSGFNIQEIAEELRLDPDFVSWVVNVRQAGGTRNTEKYCSRCQRDRSDTMEGLTFLRGEYLCDDCLLGVPVVSSERNQNDYIPGLTEMERQEARVSHYQYLKDRRKEWRCA